LPKATEETRNLFGRIRDGKGRCVTGLFHTSRLIKLKDEDFEGHDNMDG
jgi:hypothetical protein